MIVEKHMFFVRILLSLIVKQTIYSKGLRLLLIVELVCFYANYQVLLDCSCDLHHFLQFKIIYFNVTLLVTNF